MEATLVISFPVIHVVSVSRPFCRFSLNSAWEARTRGCRAFSIFHLLIHIKALFIYDPELFFVYHINRFTEFVEI
jgi:hypothetical protein